MRFNHKEIWIKSEKVNKKLALIIDSDSTRINKQNWTSLLDAKYIHEVYEESINTR